MKISFNTAISADRIRNNDGYGYGTERILASLRSVGYEVTENDPSADVGFVFNQPQHANYFGSQYRILLHPWESTLLMPDWPGVMNDCDEVWAPSPLIGRWYAEYNDVVKPIFTYEHGIDPVWTPKPRPVKGPLKFLHVGGEAYRKDMPMTIKAFRAAFGDKNPDVELLMKTGINGFNVNNPADNVHSLNGKLPFNDLLELHYGRNVFVYPSWGEGFGFNPFQAMATGMPTIVTEAWAPYARFIDPNLAIDSTMVDSPWPDIHPGQMFRPDFDDLVEKYRWVYENYDQAHERAQSVAPQIHEEYNWDTVTKKTFGDLENRLA